MVQNGSTTLRKPEPHRFKVSQISLEKFNYSNFRSQKVCTGGKSGIFKANNQVHQVTCESHKSYQDASPIRAQSYIYKGDKASTIQQESGTWEKVTFHY